MQSRLIEALSGNRAADIKMVGQKKPECVTRRYRYKSNMLDGSFPVLVIVVCFFIIANIRCDQVGSSNGSSNSLQSTTHSKANKVQENTAKLDPLDMLREIYLDHNSKVITMLVPPSGTELVQKFHPNGRYGRRSVDNLEGPTTMHSELGRLQVKEPSLGMLLRRYAEKQSVSANLGGSKRSNGLGVAGVIDDSSTYDQELELNKLLKCNYTGRANLYWCENTTD